MAYKVCQVETTPFNDELSAKKHATEMFPSRNRGMGIVSVEVRKEDGEVVFSHSAGAA